jgi:hypothetical protein
MLARTAEWYRDLHAAGKLLSREQLSEYVSDARRAGMAWATR